MKAKLKQNQTEMQKHNSKVMQLLNLIELSDQEAELVIGGVGEVVISINITEGNTMKDLCNKCWGSGSGGSSGNGGGGGG